MGNNKCLGPSGSSIIEASPKALSRHQNRIVFHLGYAPIALLAFIGTFIYQCVVIPTAGKLILCVAAICISLIILKNSGRVILRTLKHEEDSGAPSSMKKDTKKKLVVYYAGFFLLVALTVATGCYLNTYYLDQDKAAGNWSHFEQIFRLPIDDTLPFCDLP